MSLVLPVVGSILVATTLHGHRYMNLSLHSLIETFGGVLALVTAGIVLAQRMRTSGNHHFLWLACGLTGMGTLDVFHAAVSPGNAFVWLRSMAAFVGGSFFSAVWVRTARMSPRSIVRLALATFLAAMGVGILSCLFPEAIPMMAREGRFSVLAQSLHVAGGLGFAAAAVFFVFRFHRWRARNDWLFAVMTQLLAAAALLFGLSELWDASWWWWHILRLVAYMAACAFAVTSYWATETELRALNRRLLELNRDLDRAVAERTEELRASQERFDLAVRGSMDGLWDWNVLTDEVYYAPRFKELLGHADHEIENVFASFESRLHPEDRDRTLAAVQAHLEHRKPYDVEYRLRVREGSYCWFRARGQAVWDETGRATRMAGSITDITDRHQAMQAMRLAKEAAEAANRAKSDFLANMSHEIRTPLNAVIGMTELVLDTELGEQQREYLKMVIESGELLLAVINEILDLSKIEAGKIQLETEEFSLRELLGDTMKSLAVRAHGKNLELAYEVADEVPDRLIGDPNRLRQVFLNLVGNAIKFTEEGEVVVHVRCLPDARSSEIVLRCEVTDTGIGIPAEKQSEIFEAFSQVDTSTTRRYGGTGLGLTICTKLIELMRGRIWVESEVGRGSTFAFTAGFGRGTEEAAPQLGVDLAALRNTPVLIVDDNGTNRRILEGVLRQLGLAPTCAASANEALTLLKANTATARPFQLVLTDVNMPDMDGITLCQQIRRLPELADLVLIVLTSGDRDGDRRWSHSLDVAAHLLKPVKRSELQAAIGNALSRAGTSKSAASRPLPTAINPEQPLRILLVEDSLMNQKLAVGLLTKWGHEVRIAPDGKQAIACLEDDPFDLVLMDVQMPVMNGFDATKAIRQRERATGGRIPIIAMTAHALSEDRAACFAAGMDGFVAKPMRQQDLLDAIRAIGSPG